MDRQKNTSKPLLTADTAENIQKVKASGILDYRSEAMPIWCPGCGYYGICHAVDLALNALGVAPKDLVVVSGIGCSGRYPFFTKCYGFHTIHGRTLPVASGVKLARPELTVMALSGDGDGLAIGGGHLPHAIRRNVDITYLLFDNGIYGLTKGQSSPTTPYGQITGTHPYGNPEQPLNPILMALSYGASFVAGGYAAEPTALQNTIKAAFTHKGFSFVDIISPCVTFDHTNLLYDILREKFAPLPKNHNNADLQQAMTLAIEKKFYSGIYFQEDKPVFAPGQELTT